MKTSTKTSGPDKDAPTMPVPATKSARVLYGPGGIFQALGNADLAENPVLLDMLEQRAALEEQ